MEVKIQLLLLKFRLDHMFQTYILTSDLFGIEHLCLHVHALRELS